MDRQFLIALLQRALGDPEALEKILDDEEDGDYPMTWCMAVGILYGAAFVMAMRQKVCNPGLCPRIVENPRGWGRPVELHDHPEARICGVADVAA